MGRLRQNLLLLAANLLIILGVLIFMAGYFRARPRMSTEGEVDMQRTASVTSESAPFDKIVFMMIDALRSDFVYAENSGFTFTQSLIRSGAAIPFTARAASPTLTLSRIKALTQGTSQSFIDAWLNVMHSADARRLEGEDTWLSRLKADRDVEKKMVFYGVDMWLMLYPEIWDRHETIDSFYLPEFTAVDSNITRHLPDELESDDWKALVLHYVGLDNIAHFGGSNGSYMLPKQAEMDSVVQLIYEAIQHKPHLEKTLFILNGDHGMSEKGNHGGDSPSEIAAAMTFISPRFNYFSKGLESPLAATPNYEYYRVINQIDIVPTLAGLLGFSIPVSSVGIFISDFLDLFQSFDDGLLMRLKNAKQIMDVFRTNFNMTAIDSASCGTHCGSCQNEEGRVVCLWDMVRRAEQEWQTSQTTRAEDLTRAISDFCDYAQQCLSVPLNNLSFLHLSVGIMCLALSILLLFKCYSLSEVPWDSGSLIWGTFATLHAVTMFISQLVEEEHHYWYWTSLVWLSYLGFKRVAKGEYWLKAACPVGLQFLSQCFNPSGDVPYSAVEYIHDLLFDYPIILWALGSLTYIFAVNTVSKYLGMGSLVSLVVSCVLSFLAIVFKLCSTYRFNPELLNFAPLWLEKIVAGIDSNYILRIFWTGLVACLAYFLLQFKFSGQVSRKVMMIGVVGLANLYLTSQTRPKNLAMFSIFDLQLKWLLSLGTELGPSEIAVTTLLLGQSAFYASGRTNSFASFDMMNGYNGIDHTNDEANVLAVSLQTVLSNWLSPVWWSLAALRMLLASHEAQNAPTQNQSEKSGKILARSTSNDAATEKSPSYLDGSDKTKSNDIENDRIRESVINHNTFSGSSSSSADNTERIATQSRRRPFFEHLTFQTIFTASSSLSVMLACVWLRNDASLWTVLAPKYVNVALWAAFHHLLINAVLCTAIWVLVV